tara:strand:+ start:168 stop:461 length:294 start_codon:yes stop_codon:yes gene_type:complete
MVESLLSAAIGPFGAVAVLLLVLLGCYKIVTLHALPLASAWVKDQRDSFKEIMDEHAKDRDCFKESIQILAKRSDKIEDDVSEIKSDLRTIKNKVGV